MNRPKIMLVDDEEFVLTSLKRTLRREGYELVAFSRAEDGLEYLADDEVDVIISDHRMPAMTGLEFLIETRKKKPNVVRILLTGYADMDVAIRAVNEGKLFRFLTKPWNNEELKQAVHNALQMRELTGRNRKLLDQIKRQEDYIKSIESTYPGIGKVKRTSTGAIIIDEY